MAIKIEGMAPLLQVYDMPTSLWFYRDVLGFRVMQSSGEGDNVDWVSLHANGADLMLNTVYEQPNRPEKPDQQRLEAHRDTVIFFGCPNIDHAYHHLLANGIKLQEPEITGYGWKAINFYDPDGYQICMHWPLNDEG